MIARLRAPIVLAHGLLGFQRLRVGHVTVSTYFRGIQEQLLGAGNRVLAPQVPPIAGVELRARHLGMKIDAAFPGEAVHLVGHSMGGLDARLLASDPAWHGRILSVTTIGTPHLGSSLAEFAKLRVGRVYRLLEAFHIDHRGFLDVTPRASRAFNARVTVPASVPCFSIAGRPSEQEVYWPLRRLHAVLSELEGPNDGLVSVDSALAFGTALPDWPLDHLRQMNWFPPQRGEMPATQPVELYAALVGNLAGLGFAADDDCDHSLPMSA
ncbi:MAG: hypothetical protein P4L84_12280 [Isosphaeraceae bacterium]|nr:hypothetical protein [Isosphaeraceae bacterium]